MEIQRRNIEPRDLRPTPSYWVLIDGVRVNATNYGAWKVLDCLARAHERKSLGGQVDIFCLCRKNANPHQEDLRLDVKSSPGGSGYYLARSHGRPAEAHAKGCPRCVAPTHSSLSQGRAADLDRSTPIGADDLCLGYTLVDSGGENPPRGGGPRLGVAVNHKRRLRTVANRLGTLHWIWESAGLNAWDPEWPTDAREIWDRFYRAAGRTRVQNQPRPLCDEGFAPLLMLPTGWRINGKLWLSQDNAAALDRGRGRFLVMFACSLEGAARAAVAGKSRLLRELHQQFGPSHAVPPGRVVFRDQFGVDLAASADVLAYSLTGIPVECAAIEEDCPVVAYGFASPNQTGGGSAEIVALEFMCITKQGIPVSSGFEYQVASELAHRGRRFERPLRYAGDQNRAEGHPDFWLTDAHKPVRMEVFGMNQPGAEYMKMAEAKIAKAWVERENYDFWTWFPVDCHLNGKHRRADSLEWAMSALPRKANP